MDNAPVPGGWTVTGNKALCPPAWANWFAALSRAIGWRQAFSAQATLDFPSTAAGAQSALTVPVAGAVVGQGVLVLPSADVAGIAFKGAVTAAGTVTVYALNCTAGAIDPPSQAYTVVVLGR